MRQARTSPPPKPQQDVVDELLPDHSWDTALVPSLPTHILDLPDKNDDNNNNNYDWKTLCRTASLDANSRVVVVGAFSSPVGPPTALLLTHQCSVQHLTLVDPLVPNMSRHRFRILDEHLRPLQRVVPNLQLVHVPHHQHQPEHDFSATTHVLHLWENPLLQEFMSESNQRLYTTQNALTTMQEMIRVTTEARWLYVAPSSDGDDADSLTTDKFTTTLADRLMRTMLQSSLSSSCHQIELPPLHGLIVERAPTGPSVHVEDAVAAILMAWQPPQTPATKYTLPMSLISATPTTSRSEQKLAWQLDHNHSYATFHHRATTELTQAATLYQETMGMHQPLFPCASACRRHTSDTCLPSAWDDILTVSQEATLNCTFVVYYSNMNPTLDTLVRPIWRSEQLCRVAYVSGRAPLVERVINHYLNTTTNVTVTDELLEAWNGKVTSGGWTLVWLAQHDDLSLSDADNALPVIDPSRLFAPNVEKVLYTDAAEFAQSSDRVLLRILSKIDQPAYNHRVEKQFRSGSKSIFRWVPLPPQRARKVIFFVGASGPEFTPTGARDFDNMVKDFVTLPPKQLDYYERVANWVQMETDRPESEMQDVLYDHSFPYLWVSLTVMSHDLKEDEAHRLRCEWLEEYLYWGESNRQAEELSLAFVLARRRLLGQLGSLSDDDSSSFLPLNVKRKDYDVFLRVLQRRDTPLSTPVKGEPAEAAN